MEIVCNRPHADMWMETMVWLALVLVAVALVRSIADLFAPRHRYRTW